MKQFTRGAVLLVAAVGLWSCSGDPTSEFRGEPTTLVVNPDRIFVEAEDDQEIIVQVLDAQGNPLAADFEATGGNGTISVAEDESYQGILQPDGTLAPPPERVTARFVVTAGTTLGTTELTISAGGLSKTVRVDVTPADLAATFSTLTPGLGEQVVLTAPAGACFKPDAAITFTGVRPEGDPDASPRVSPDPTIVAVDEAACTLTFIPGPNANSVGTVSGVTLAYNTDVTFEVQTVDVLVSPVVDEFSGTLSTATPAQNEAVTLTGADANFGFTDTTTVTVGETAAIVTSVAADGSSITFVPVPGSTGAVSVNPAIVGGFPLALSLPAAQTVTAPAAAPLAGSGDPATAPVIAVPAPGETTVLFNDASNLVLRGDQHYYQFTIAEEMTLTILNDWSDHGADIDFYVLDALGATVEAFETAAAPEGGEVTLAPGTYFLNPFMWDAHGATLTWVSVQLTRAEAAAPAAVRRMTAPAQRGRAAGR